MEAQRWTPSDRLAIALACLAAVMALALLWMDKTPIWAGVTVACMCVLIVYPVIHFVPSCRLRIPTLLVVWLLIGLFGWKIWPRNLADSNRVAGTTRPLSAPQSGPTSLPPPNVAPVRIPKSRPTPNYPKSLPSSPNKEQKCETGSICNQDSPNQGTQTVNNGPPPAKLFWDQSPADSVRGQAVTKITYQVDHSLEVPEFVATCDRPCDWAGIGSVTDTISYVDCYRLSANSWRVVVGTPRPLGPGVILLVQFGSTGEAPKILSFEAIKQP